MFRYTLTTVAWAIGFTRPDRSFLRYLVYLILVFIAPSLWAQAEEGYIDVTRRVTEVRVETALEDWLQQTGIPGGVIAVVQGSDVLALQARGLADRKSSAPFDATRTVVWAGDLVRMLTAAAVLQLQEQGDLDLETDVNRHLVGLALRPQLPTPVTASDLLTESSGIDGLLTGTWVLENSALQALGDYLRRRLPPRVRPAGMISVASANDFAVAGYLVESLSGLDFGDYLHDRLTGPVGMNDTAIRLSADLRARRASGYVFRGGLIGTDALEPKALAYPQTEPGSSLWTTAADMARWMRMLLSNNRSVSQPVLERSSIERILTPQFESHPYLSGHTLGMVSTRMGDHAVVSLSSISNGFSTLLVMVPDRDLGMFLACNAEASLFPPLGEVMSLLLGPTNETSGEQPAAASAEPGIGLGLAGWYRDSTLSHSSPEKLLSLFRQERVEFDDDGSLIWRQHRIEPIGGLTFAGRAGDPRIVFLRPADGRTYMATDDVVLERLGWFETWPVQAGVWWIFASALLAFAWTPVRPMPPARPEIDEAGEEGPRWPFLLARSATLIYFLFLVGLVFWLAQTLNQGPASLIFGPPSYLRPLLTLPRLALLLSAPVIASVPVAWLRGHWGASRWGQRQRWRLTLMATLLLAIVPFLRFWRLVGFQI